ncbi:hypothetical protein BYT27DRAFT_7144645 [Phlegmacium glaucopus]|nr:hypothetical protein BYT27DRAFT_7144645 [Phlegmacium glaucopus]
MHLLVVAAIANVALAYSNTHPLVAWSSSSSYVLDSLPPQLSNNAHPDALLESILLSDGSCNHDAIVIIEQPGLHASDLRNLSPNTHITRTLLSAVSARQYPYVPVQNGIDISSICDRLSSRCRSQLLEYSLDQSDITLVQNTKHVVCLTMPTLHEYGTTRQDAMTKYESLLADELSLLATTFPDHLVVYTGSPLPTHYKRQPPDIPERPVLNFDVVPLAANTTLPTGGILKRFQLLTPGLITALLVTFFILVPVTMLGLNALASIQNPLRVDTSKTFNAQERKNQ